MEKNAERSEDDSIPQAHVSSYPGQYHAHLAAVVHASDDAIISKSLDGLITSWNPAAEKLFGYSAGESIGKKLVELLPPDRLEEESNLIEQLKTGRRVDNYETTRLTKDNRLIHLSLSASPIRDEGGAITGIVKVTRDITKKKLDERTGLENQERYRLALETGRIGTWEFDPVSLEFIVSSEVRRAYNLPEAMPLSVEIMESMIHPDDRQLVNDSRARVFDPLGNGQFEVEHRIITYDGQQVKWTRIGGKAFFNPDGSPQKLIGTFLDVTNERMAKEQLELEIAKKTQALRDLNEKLNKSNQDLEQFAYIASHDLQEPLRKIMSFTDILRQKKDITGTEPYMDKIIEAASRMSALINGVLDYSRLGGIGKIPTAVDLNEVLADVRKDYDDLIKTKNCRITNNELPVVPGNAVQLRQLFANLISNSLKFCEDSPEITVTARQLPGESRPIYPQLDPGREYVQLLFSDNGVGFDQSNADKLFVLFNRLHGRKYNGSGIGLALCKKIVDNHQGLITGESNSRQGAVFTVILPRE